MRKRNSYRICALFYFAINFCRWLRRSWPGNMKRVDRRNLFILMNCFISDFFVCCSWIICRCIFFLGSMLHWFWWCFLSLLTSPSWNITLVKFNCDFLFICMEGWKLKDLCSGMDSWRYFLSFFLFSYCCYVIILFLLMCMYI